MDTMKKCVVAEQVCELLIGGALGVVMTNNVMPKCTNGAEKLLVLAGTCVGAWAAGRGFAKKFYSFCDAQFGTDFGDETYNL